MLKPKLDIFEIFGQWTSYPGPWKPLEGKRHEWQQTMNLIEDLKAYTEQVKDYVAAIPGLKIASDFKLGNLEIVLKNITWLTSISIKKLGHLRFFTSIEDPMQANEIPGIGTELAPFKELISRGIIIPTPSTIEEYDDIHEHKHTIDLGKDVLNAAFSNEFLTKQMTEQLTGAYPCGVLELLLPRVAAIPISEILKLRTDYKELFTRFQNKLTMFIRSSDESDSERKLVDLLKHIDEEIHGLNNEFEKIDHQKRLEQIGLAYSFGVMSLVLFLPSEVYKSFAALMGSSNLGKALKNIRLLEIKRMELTNDPFYIPYKLTKLSKQFAQHS